MLDDPAEIGTRVALGLGEVADAAVTGNDHLRPEPLHPLKGSAPAPDLATREDPEQAVGVDQIAGEEDTLFRQPDHSIAGKVGIAEKEQLQTCAAQLQARLVADRGCGSRQGLGSRQTLAEYACQLGQMLCAIGTLGLDRAFQRDDLRAKLGKATVALPLI
jgi:hypothetical protein